MLWHQLHAPARERRVPRPRPDRVTRITGGTGKQRNLKQQKGNPLPPLSSRFSREPRAVKRAAHRSLLARGGAVQRIERLGKDYRSNQNGGNVGTRTRQRHATAHNSRDTGTLEVDS